MAREGENCVPDKSYPGYVEAETTRIDRQRHERFRRRMPAEPLAGGSVFGPVRRTILLTHQSGHTL